MNFIILQYCTRIVLLATPPRTLSNLRCLITKSRDIQHEADSESSLTRTILIAVVYNNPPTMLAL